MALHAHGPAAALVVPAASADPARGGRAHRSRLVDLPSRVVAHRAAGLRRAARPGAVALPGRRQCRIGARAAARGVRRPAARPAEPRLVRGCAASSRCRCSGAVGQLVQRDASAPSAAAPRAARPPSPDPPPGGTSRSRSCSRSCSRSTSTSRASAPLHLLPDRDLPRVGAGARSSTCSFSSARVALGTLLGGPVGDRFGRKYVIWVSILGVLPFTLALPHANLALTRRAERAHRPDPGLGFLGDPRLRAGARAGTVGTDRGAVLRARVRDWRPRRAPPSASSPTPPASASCSGSARGCRRSGCSRRLRLSRDVDNARDADYGSRRGQNNARPRMPCPRERFALRLRILRQPASRIPSTRASPWTDCARTFPSPSAAFQGSGLRRHDDPDAGDLPRRQRGDLHGRAVGAPQAAPVSRARSPASSSTTVFRAPAWSGRALDPQLLRPARVHRDAGVAGPLPLRRDARRHRAERGGRRVDGGDAVVLPRPADERGTRPPLRRGRRAGGAEPRRAAGPGFRRAAARRPRRDCRAADSA